MYEILVIAERKLNFGFLKFCCDNFDFRLINYDVIKSIDLHDKIIIFDDYISISDLSLFENSFNILIVDKDFSLKNNLSFFDYYFEISMNEEILRKEIEKSVFLAEKKKKQLKELHDESDLRKMVLESLDFPFYFIDIENGKIHYENEKGQMLPIDNFFIKNKSGENVFLKENYLSLLKKVKSKNEKDIKEQIIFINDEERYFEIHIFPTKEMKNVIVYFIDITDKKHDELELRKLHSAIEQSSASIIITDISGRIEYVNRAFEIHSGYLSKDVIGRNPRILKTNYLDKKVYKNLWDTISSGKYWVGEFYNRKKNGEFYWEEAIITPVKNQNGKIVNYIAVKEDITERKKNQELLYQAKKEAEDANLAKSIFLANMSHEVRTPLNSIIGFSEILLEEETDSEKSEKLHYIIKSGKHMLNLVNDILDLSKIESGKFIVEEKEFSLKMLFEHQYEIFSLLASEKELKLFFEIDESVPDMVKGDERKLLQIIINILTNSIKFTHSGYVKLKVSYSDNKIKMIFSDTGIGIEKKNFDSIFSLFRQADSSVTKEYSGTGLGLTIVKKLCNLLGGNLFIESNINQGTIITVFLPCEKAENLTSADFIFQKEEDTNFIDYIFEKSNDLYNIIENSEMDNISAITVILNKIRNIEKYFLNSENYLYKNEMLELLKNINRNEIDLENLKDIMKKIIGLIYFIKYNNLHKIYKVLVADNQIELTKLAKEYLKKSGFRCDFTFDVKELNQLLLKNKYDIIICNKYMLELMIKSYNISMEYLNKSYIILLLSEYDGKKNVTFLDKVETDYLYKPFNKISLFSTIGYYYRYIKKNAKIFSENMNSQSNISITKSDLILFQKYIEELKENRFIFDSTQIIDILEKMRDLTFSHLLENDFEILSEAAEEFDEEKLNSVINYFERYYFKLRKEQEMEDGN